MGTTHAAGFDVSAGRPQGTTLDNGANSALIENDTCKLKSSSYDLPLTWNTDVKCLSLNDDLIKEDKN